MRLPVLSVCLCLCGLAVSTAKAGEFREPLPSGAVRQVRDTTEIISEYLRQQEMFLPIAPPDPDFILIQGGGLLLFDPSDFPAPFVDGLLPTEIDGIAVFPVTVFEDPLTHERVILNAADRVIGTLMPSIDYDPRSFAKAWYPAAMAAGGAESDWLSAIYDPSRIVIDFHLVLEGDLILLESLATARHERSAGQLLMMGEEGGVVSNLMFTAIAWADGGGLELTLEWPPGGLATNALDIFACTDWVAGDWVLLDTFAVASSTNRVSWTDAAAAQYPQRFYDAWTLFDSDGDGLPDGREVRLYGTDPGIPDTSGDGLPDGWLVQHGFDPLDPAIGGQDADGDGLTNLEEYLLGTDPNVASAPAPDGMLVFGITTPVRGVAP